MKKCTWIVSLLTAAMLSATLYQPGTLRVSAAEPTTFYLKYICTDCLHGEKKENGEPNFAEHEEGHTYEWRVQVGNWDNNLPGREPYYLSNGDEKAKDGDVLVVLPNYPEPEKAEDEDNTKTAKQNMDGTVISVNARLSNLTVNRASVLITTGGVDNCYVLGDSYASIGGNVTNAYVYDATDCTFSGNVTNLHLVDSVGVINKPGAEADLLPNVTVSGTVQYAAVEDKNGVQEEYWNFAANTFSFNEKTGLKTPSGQYSTSGAAPSASGASAAGNKTSSTAASGEYDDVPKTGENNLVLWLLLLSGICFIGHLAVRKTIS